MTDDLIKRLRARKTITGFPGQNVDGHLINPDGPEAADALERMAGEVERMRTRHERRDATSRRLWLRAARAALSVLPGASRSDHPAYGLWLRAEMADAPPVAVTLSHLPPPPEEGTKAGEHEERRGG